MSQEKLATQIRREQIVEAALALVASQGLRRLSVAALARRVGLVPSGIYRHFRSKDEILEAVLDLVEERLMSNVRAAREESPDPVECLHGVFLRHVRFIREGRAVPRLIFSDDVHAGHPDRRLRVQRILGGYLGQLSQIVREGQQQHRIREDLDPDAAALLLIGMVVPAALLWHLSEGGFDVTRHAQRVWPIFREAIEPRLEEKAAPGEVTDCTPM